MLRRIGARLDSINCQAQLLGSFRQRLDLSELIESSEKLWFDLMYHYTYFCNKEMHAYVCNFMLFVYFISCDIIGTTIKEV